MVIWSEQCNSQGAPKAQLLKSTVTQQNRVQTALQHNELTEENQVSVSLMVCNTVLTEQVPIYITLGE